MNAIQYHLEGDSVIACNYPDGERSNLPRNDLDTRTRCVLRYSGETL